MEARPDVAEGPPEDVDEGLDGEAVTQGEIVVAYAVCGGERGEVAPVSTRPAPVRSQMMDLGTRLK